MKIRIFSLYYLYFGLILFGMSGFIFTLFAPKPVGFYAFIVTAALGGFGVAANIFYTKKTKRQLVCPTGSDCNVVVNSRYSKFFGVPLEYLGMFYFVFIAAAYLALIAAPHFFSANGLTVLVALTLGAGLFSCYLLFVQAFLLRAWCIWCILASFLSLTVFTVSFVSVPVAVNFIAEFQWLVEMTRTFGFAFAVGGATAAVFLFFRFLNDLEIDDRELSLLNGILELVWLGFGLILISQLSLFVVYSASLIYSGNFIVQTIALFVAVFGGAVSMIIYAPFLVFVPFKKIAQTGGSAFTSLRLPTFVVWAVTLASWYFALALDFIAEVEFTKLFPFYLGFLLLSIGLSLLWERRLMKKTAPAEPDKTAVS